MAVVTLDRVFLSLAADHTSVVPAFSADRSEVLAAPGEIRRMANGRLRTVTRAGSARTLGVTLRLLTPAQVALLRSWPGRTVLFRDVWGRKMYGAFFGLDIKDYADRSGQDATFVLSEVTVSEAV